MGLYNISQLPQNGEPSPSITNKGEILLSTAPNVVVPVYASWFEPGKIHDIERRSLPEFFPTESLQKEPVAEKTPELYLEYRDFMVQTYRLRPKEYLTVTTCRRHLAGDVGAIIRVHSFLEQWGLVNFQADLPAGKRERSVQLPSMATIDLPTAISSAVQASAINTKLAESIPNKDKKAKETGLDGDSNIKGESGLPKGPTDPSTIMCVQCWKECNKFYYTHSPPAGRHMANLNLCGLCYAEGRYPTALYSGDFVKVDVSAMEQGVRLPWTDEETLVLLQAVEEFKEDWDAVAQRVGRPRDQCVYQFLKLPGVDSINIAGNIPEMAKGLPAGYAGMPFSVAGNPLMSTLAFLAGAVHPKVAAAAAQAAISQITQQREENASAMEVDSGDAIPESDDLAKVAATGIACAASRAHQFANEESRKAVKLRDTLVELQLQKLRVKVALYEELERTLEDDRKDIEQQRLALFFDRFNLRKNIMGLEHPKERVELQANGGEKGEDRNSPSQNITKL
jgi:SWI/SNF related-matrix-associated actin-dependent regulator of chromatin subfamily C